jgi:hypothetical protein
MAITATLVHDDDTGGLSTTAKTWTYDATTAGVPHLVVLAKGDCNGEADVFPSTITWGGQTISRVAQADTYWFVEIAAYYADSTDVGAMSGGAGTATYNTTLAASYEIQVAIIELDTSDDTIVDSGAEGFDYVNDMTIDLTTVSGDLCLMCATQRADQTALSLDTGMTALGTVAASSSDAAKTTLRFDTKTATTTSTSVSVGGGVDEQHAVLGIALREAAGGGSSIAPLAAAHLNQMKRRAA